MTETTTTELRDDRDGDGVAVVGALRGTPQGPALAVALGSVLLSLVESGAAHPRAARALGHDDTAREDARDGVEHA